MGDQTVSYYIHSPAGFFIEYGWDDLPVDDLARRSPGNMNLRKGKRPDMWAHKYRLQPSETVYPYQPWRPGRVAPGVRRHHGPFENQGLYSERTVVTRPGGR